MTSRPATMRSSQDEETSGMRLTVVFSKCRHNPKRLAGKASFRYAVLSCSITAGDEEFRDLSCLVQHPHDTNESNLIISRPATYSGPFDPTAFGQCAKDYYRLCSPGAADREPQTDQDIFLTKAYTFHVAI